MPDVRVLVVGQDPYPTPGHPVGFSFSVAPDVQPVPRSLQNIYAELGTDLGLPTPGNGDLTPWFHRGVMLLNRVLTVRPGASASHQGKGWEPVTAQAISALAERGGPLVAILWGRQAQSLAPMLGDVPRIESAHPSPCSALIYVVEALAWGIYDFGWAGTTHYWWGFLIAGILLILFGVILGLIAARLVKRAVPPTPQMAIEEGKLIRETLQHPHPDEARVPAAPDRVGSSGNGR